MDYGELLMIRRGVNLQLAAVLLLTTGYLLVFMQRTGPGVITDQLQQQFHVSAAVLGTLASIQYFLYMVLQIPVGILGDKFRPGRLFAFGLLLDGLGTLLFTHSTTFPALLCARALVGFGDAFIWVNIVLILGQRFMPQEFGRLLAVVGTGGNIGALLTTVPFALWIAAAGWHTPFTILGGLLVVMAVFSVFFLGGQTKPANAAAKTKPNVKLERVPVWSTLAVVVKDRVAWSTFACHFGVVGTYTGFVSVWAVPYFMATYGVSRSGATVFTMVAFVGAILGGPIAGGISDKYGSRRRPYIIFQVATTLAWLCIPLFGGRPPVWLAYILMFVVGLGVGASLLTFAVIRDQTPSIRSGVTSGFANTGGFLSAVLLPVVFGAIIDALSKTGASASPHVFAAAFVVPALFSSCGVVGSLLIPERKPEAAHAA